MDHPDIRVNAELQTRLSDAELAYLLAHLHPVDCQLCGRPLGDRAPALVVVHLAADQAEAILVHTRCSPPGWVTEADLDVPDDPYGTWHAGVAAVPVAITAETLLGAEPPDLLPAIVVNPGLDSVHLTRRGRTWKPDLALAAGDLAPLADLSAEPVGAHRIASARLRVDGTTVVVGSDTDADRYWAGADEDLFWSGLEVRGGVLLVLTYSLDPHEMTTENLAAMRDPGESLAGWVRRSD